MDPARMTVHQLLHQATIKRDQIRANESDRAKLVRERDALIAEAHAKGASWPQLMRASGIRSKTGMASALRRMRAI